MPGHRLIIRRPFKFEYRLPAPLEVRYHVFQMNAVDVPTRLEAISALLRLGDPTAADALVEALDEPLAVRVFAAEALRGLVPEAPTFDPYADDSARSAGAARIKTWWRDHRAATLEAWLAGQLGVRSWDRRPARLAALAAGLEHADPAVRYHAHLRLTSETDAEIPYEYNWLPSLRAEAVAAWRRWLVEHVPPPPATDD